MKRGYIPFNDQRLMAKYNMIKEEAVIRLFCVAAKTVPI